MTARPRLHTGIVKEIVTQVLKNPHLIDDCLGLITTSLPARSGLAMQMLHSLATSMTGRNRREVQGARLNPLGLFLTPLGLFLRTSIPLIWRILSAFLRA